MVNMGEGYYMGMEETYSKRIDELKSEVEQLKADVETTQIEWRRFEGEYLLAMKACDTINALYQQSLKTNQAQAKHSAEQRKAIDTLMSANEFLSKRIDAYSQTKKCRCLSMEQCSICKPDDYYKPETKDEGRKAL